MVDKIDVIDTERYPTIITEVIFHQLCVSDNNYAGLFSAFSSGELHIQKLSFVYLSQSKVGILIFELEHNDCKVFVNYFIY